MKFEIIGDLIGDGVDFILVFVDFLVNIIGIGSLFDICFNVFVNGMGLEEFVVDNFCLFEIFVCIVLVIMVNLFNRLICVSGNIIFLVFVIGVIVY